MKLHILFITVFQLLEQRWTFRIENENLLCQIEITPFSLKPADITQFVRAFKVFGNFPQLLNDVLVTEEAIFEDAAEYNKNCDNEDVKMPIMGLIKKYGFKPEAFEVETDDGYLLTLHRIKGCGTPVLLMHTLFSSGDDFVTAGPESAMAYKLAEEGFDVYIGNARGTKHSRKHKTLSPDCGEFWDFSWYEISVYDVPAIIDFILKLTKEKQLIFIGHSQGSTNFFVLGSERPEYLQKISFVAALSPVAWINNLGSPVIRFAASDPDHEYMIARAFGQNEVPFLRALADILCTHNKLSEIVCSNVMYILFGFDRGNWNITNLPVNLGHTPAGASTKTFIHYIQEVRARKFCKFDYGKKENLKKYGCEEPPEFDVSCIHTPVALFYSDKDWISNETDVMYLKSKLPNVVETVFIEDYWYLDYLWAKNVNEKVNRPLIDRIYKYVDNVNSKCTNRCK